MPPPELKVLGLQVKLQEKPWPPPRKEFHLQVWGELPVEQQV